MIDVFFEEPIPLWKRRLGRVKFGGLVRIARSTLRTWVSMDIALVFTSDERVKELNARYRGIRRVTDVLSFTIPPAKDERVSGEIYVAVGQAMRQARRYKTSLDAEVLRLVIHGVLHLQGYDHVKAGERTIMRALEKRICSAFRNSK